MSTYSPNLRIELITTGTQAGTWGTTTNSNLAYVIDWAIAGNVSITTGSASQALTYVNGPTSTAADNQSVQATLTLNTSTGANFAIYAPPVSKLYVIKNASSYVATIYNSTVIGNTTAAGSGVAVPAGATMTVWSDGTNFYQQNTYLNGPTFATPVLGTPTSGTLTNCTGLPVATGISGLGTGVSTFLGTPSSDNLRAALTDETGTGSAVFATSPTLVTPNLGTPSAVNLTNATNIPTNQFTGTIPVSSGGTGASTLTNAAILRGNGAGAISAASASDIVTAIGTTAVTNATLATNASNMLGYGQSWSDYSGSRSTGTNYTNSTGRTLAVCVSLQGGDNASCYVYINGTAYAYRYQIGANVAAPIFFLVPDGQTYQVTSGLSVNYWMELR